MSEMAPEPVLVWTVRCPTEPDTWHDTEPDTWHDTEDEANRQVNWLRTRDPNRQVVAFTYPVLIWPEAEEQSA